MFMAVLFLIAKNWKQYNCLSTGEWISKSWNIQTVEYHSAIKRNELLTQQNGWIYAKWKTKKTEEKALQRDMGKIVQVMDWL